jgi:hypothetical protein
MVTTNENIQPFDNGNDYFLQGSCDDRKLSCSKITKERLVQIEFSDVSEV